jgi:tetratricopeptide (TPR) repeat protein
VRVRFVLAAGLFAAGDRGGELLAYRAAAAEAEAGLGRESDPRYRALAAEALTNLGMALNELGRTRDAREPLAKAETHLRELSEGKPELLDGKLDRVKLRADLANCRSELAQVLGDLGKSGEARKLLDAVVTTYEDLVGRRGTADDRFNLAYAHLRRCQLIGKCGDLVGAEAEFGKAAQRISNDGLDGLKPFAHATLGELHWAAREPEKAESDYRKAREGWEKSVSESAADLVSVYSLAWLLSNCPVASIRDEGRAVELARKLTAARPREPKYWQVLGIAQFRAGNWAEAVKALSESEAQCPEGRGHGLNHLFLAMAYEKRGEKQAREAYEKARKWVHEERQDREVLRFLAEAEELIDPPGRDGER